MKFIDLTGQKFNKLTVIKPNGKNKWGDYKWLCKCDCGKEKIILGYQIKNGYVKSFGCLGGENRLKHGRSHTKTYQAWVSLNSRCNNPNDKDYKNYGGRTPPITVCYRWSNKNPNGFNNFYKDVGDPPSQQHSIDRTNNNKGYFPNNWRWATKEEQQRNRRNNINIPFNNKYQCSGALAKEYNINRATLRSRLNSGQSIEEALTRPVKKYKNKGK